VWTPDETDAAAVGEGIYGALSAAYKQGRATCSLSTDNQQNPTAEIKSITLLCYPGHSQVSILIAHYQGQKSVSVSKTLKAD
jgi:hypothetical protein